MEPKTQDTWFRTKTRSNAQKNKLQDFITKYKTPCCECGEDHPAVLDFHHVDPSQKSFSINEGIKNKVSCAKMLTEIEKCIVLCSNCHRKHHYAEDFEKRE